MRTRVKICGITRVDDMSACSDLGVDAIGLVFYPGSPRYIRAESAREILQGAAPFMSIVGLFMDADSSDVKAILDQIHLDILQFHGSESPAYCEQFGIPYIKAIAMGDQSIDINESAQKYTKASGFLLDSHSQGTAGGSGHTFDWDKIPSHMARPMILAGGLNPDNVQSAIRTVHPYAVDCSSGVEASPGIKDHDKIRIFMEKVADV